MSAGVRERLRRTAWGPLALLLVSTVAVATVIVGNIRGPGITVRYVDAGPLSDYEVSSVVYLAEEEIYVVGLADGRLRAVDGEVASSRCSVRYLPRDERGRARNPLGVAGVFEDPCTGSAWAVTGDALDDGSEPLRTRFVWITTAEDGVQRVFVEVADLDRG
ncbi:MAG: hypothetical protein F4150_05630 [Chloroflexi bacterium]|nr:hypothetical protein [Chloroflexota bacterium]